MASDNLAFPLHDAHGALILYRAMIAAPLSDPNIVRRAIHQLTPNEIKRLERVADHIAHACTLALGDPWAAPTVITRKQAD